MSFTLNATGHKDFGSVEDQATFEREVATRFEKFIGELDSDTGGDVLMGASFNGGQVTHDALTASRNTGEDRSEVEPTTATAAERAEARPEVAGSPDAITGVPDGIPKTPVEGDQVTAPEPSPEP